MNNHFVRWLQISINCITDNPVDIRCSSPIYLIFDFNVKE